MKKINVFSLAICLTAVLALPGCGSKDSEKSASKPSANSSAAGQQYHDSLDHQAFEKKSSAMCVSQELALRKNEHPSSGNAGVADESLTNLCNCIAREESKHLTKQEAKKFVEENEYPMSLLIKQGQAEELCAKK